MHLGGWGEGAPELGGTTAAAVGPPSAGPWRGGGGAPKPQWVTAAATVGPGAVHGAWRGEGMGLGRGDIYIYMYGLTLTEHMGNVIKSYIMLLNMESCTFVCRQTPIIV